jgi:hypothetical protein
MKKFFTKISSVLPEIMLFISIFCLFFSLTLGISESAKHKARAETLAAENSYLKEEIEWFKARLANGYGIANPALPESADNTDGGPHE